MNTYCSLISRIREDNYSICTIDRSSIADPIFQIEGIFSFNQTSLELLFLRLMYISTQLRHLIDLDKLEVKTDSLSLCQLNVEVTSDVIQ